MTVMTASISSISSHAYTFKWVSPYPCKQITSCQILRTILINPELHYIGYILFGSRSLLRVQPQAFMTCLLRPEANISKMNLCMKTPAEPAGVAGGGFLLICRESAIQRISVISQLVKDRQRLCLNSERQKQDKSSKHLTSWSEPLLQS